MMKFAPLFFAGKSSIDMPLKLFARIKSKSLSSIYRYENKTYFKRSLSSNDLICYDEPSCKTLDKSEALQDISDDKLFDLTLDSSIFLHSKNEGDIQKSSQNNKFKQPKDGKSKKRRLTSSDSSPNSNAQTDVKKSKLPNYFIALRITNQEIIEGLIKVQTCITEEENSTKEALIDPLKFHITLSVFFVEKDSLSLVKEVLDRGKEKFFHEKCIRLPIGGVGNFDKKTVFAQVKTGSQSKLLLELVSYLNTELKDVDIDDRSDFKPHITLMKMSKIRHKKITGVKHIKSSFYEQYKGMFFGYQIVEGLQLCSMQTASDGYYHIEHEVKANDNDNLFNTKKHFHVIENLNWNMIISAET